MRGRPAARVQLVTPTAAWLRPFVAAVRRSRALHGRWVFPPASPAAYRAYLRRLRRATHVGYLVCRRDSAELVGVVNISEIVHGAFQSGYLGYYAFRPHAGRGLMTEGLARVVDAAFRRLGLHREPAHPMSRARESAGRTNVTRPFTARGDGVPRR
jgi:[ribosomal protein S5]-alanine N-acetyltransferase